MIYWTSWRAAVCSSNLKRGFQPPQNEKEKHFVRRVEELCGIAQKRNIARYSTFLSSREQTLAKVALNRCNCEEYRFAGGYPQAERKILCIEPLYTYAELPICCIKIENLNREKIQHRDYLGAILGLGLERECLGDIFINEEEPDIAYLFALQHVAPVICDELVSVGRCTVKADMFYGDIPFKEPDRTIRTVTVPSLRADAVLAAMLQCSRAQAVELLRAGKVEVNHVTFTSPHAAIYEDDLFTIRGKGRYRLQALGGKSRKDRLFIQFFQY